MTQKRSILTLSLLATAGLTARRCVSPTGGLPTAGGNVQGVANSNAASGDYCPVDALGTTIIEASDVIALGAEVETLNDGRIVTKDEGITIGRAQQASTAAGQFIEVFLIPN